MEGGACFGKELLEKGTSILRPTPLLTPLKRFMSSPCERELRLSNKTAPKTEEEEMKTKPNGLCEPPHLGAIGVLPRGVLLDEPGLYDGLLVGGEASYYNFNAGFVHGNRTEVVGEEKGVKSSSCSSASTNNVVKGQWTPEEDSLLVKLVKQHGVRKWSQIAKKLVGRIGKQCRERWHNHLRPDIKKETWSEEEERLLVEAHEKVGNRWAEIAKRIPGRSENSIKNHWNATKRRQNSKRKSKRKPGQGGRSQPSILQEYIRSKMLKEKTSTTPSSPFQSTIPKPPESISAYDCFSTTAQVDDCMQTMQNFFENFSQQSVCESLEDEGFQVGDIQEPFMLESLDFFGFGDDDGQFMGMDECFLASPQAPELLYGEATEPPAINSNGDGTKENTSSHLYSDIYLSYLLDGGPSPSFDSFESDNLKIMGDHDSSSCKKDMDLIEMISSSQSSCSQRSNSNSSFT